MGLFNSTAMELFRANFKEDETASEEDPRLAAARQQAYDKAHAEASASVTKRFSAIFSAPGIVGNGRRMAVALDLAAKSDMPAAELAGYVCRMVSEEGAVDSVFARGYQPPQLIATRVPDELSQPS